MKVLKKVLLFAFIFGLAGATLAGTFLWGQRAAFASQILSDVLHIPVKISKLEFPSSRSILFSDISIRGPHGSVVPTAFYIKSLWLYFDPNSIFESTIKVTNMTAEEMLVSLEIYTSEGNDNNWIRLFKEVADSKPSGSSSAFVRYLQKKMTEVDKTIEIDQISISHITCEVLDRSMRKDQIRGFKALQLRLKDIGKQSPISLRDGMSVILDAGLSYMGRTARLQRIVRGIPRGSSKLFQEVNPQIQQQSSFHKGDLANLQERSEFVTKSLEKERERLNLRFEEMERVIGAYFQRWDAMENALKE